MIWVRGVSTLQRNEVIDFRSYRGDEPDGEASGETTLDELPEGTKLLHGQYTITGYLNSGGFGITYHAKDSLGRPVVIKECFPGMMCCRKGRKVAARALSYAEELKKMVAQFVTEAHSLAALKHQNIVHVHQVFEENDTAYMAIDHIDGLDLLEIVDSHPELLTPKEIVRLTKRALLAIKFVHDKGMLHRDISPDNILIDARGEPILIDFGAARKAAPTSARAFSQMKFVKDGYSPQEFYIEGGEQGPWSDLYSFAASMYHVICGNAPEDGQKRLSALAQKEADPYLPLTGRIDGYPEGFLESIDKALEIVPQKRFQTADEWLDKLAPQPARKAKPRAKSVPRITTQPQVPQPAKKQLPALPRAASLEPIDEAAIRDTIVKGSAEQSGGSNGLMIGGAVAALLIGAGVAGYVFLGASDAPAPEAVAEVVAEPVVPVEPVAPAAEPVIEPALTEPETADVVVAEPQASPITDPELPSVSLPPVLDVPRNETVAEAPTVTDSPILPEAVATIRPVPRPFPRAEETRTLDQIMSSVTALRPVPVRVDPADLISDVAPLIAMPVVSGADYTFEFVPSERAFSGVTAEVAAPRVAAVSLPEAIGSVSAPEIDTATAAPAPAPVIVEAPAGPIAAVQVVGSHWDVEMPFEEALMQVRSAHTVQLTGLTTTADLERSGDWIAAGVTIYSFNGESLSPGLPISAHFLNELSIDPDGYARATVRYRDATTGIIDRGLLAVPIVRDITLLDGTELQTRVEGTAWTMRVTKTPETSDNGLRVGDALMQELQSGVEISTHEDLTKVFERLMSVDASEAKFNVLREGDLVQVTTPLAREKTE